jgi:hypothetical protein
MKMLPLLLIVWLLCTHVSAQTNVWHSYYDKKTELTGYKDAQGKIKVAAKFSLLTHTGIFRNIVPVSEETSKDKFTNYYLLKNGKKVGKDSLYVWDFTTDCESEEKIRFYDKKTDKVGFFNKYGKVVIPAVYNAAQPFYNGLALTIRNGKRMCYENKPYDEANPCEHWFWNGTTAIINTKNQILIDNLQDDAIWHINFYSLKVGSQPLDTTLYVNLKGINGQYYSFIDYDKEFKHWFYKSYLPQLNAGNIQAGIFSKVMVDERHKKSGDKPMALPTFTKRYSALVLKKMQAIKQGRRSADISHEDLYALSYDSAVFKPFYTDCGMPNKERYPVYSVITETYNKNERLNSQESFIFLRTGKGYKLIGMTVN